MFIKRFKIVHLHVFKSVNSHFVKMDNAVFNRTRQTELFTDNLIFKFRPEYTRCV